MELGIGFPLIAARAILRDKDGPALMDRPVFTILIADQTKNWAPLAEMVEPLMN